MRLGLGLPPVRRILAAIDEQGEIDETRVDPVGGS